VESTLAGPDINRALEACSLEGEYPARSTRRWWRLGYRPKDNKVVSISRDGSVESVFSGDSTTVPSRQPSSDLFRNAYPRPYKNWSGNSIEIFSALSTAIVAGTHITEDSQLQTSVSGLTCPTDNAGNITFPSPDNGSLSCSLAGKNLDKVAKISLRNAKDATDATTAEGSVSVSGDSTKATVIFLTSALRLLPQPAYAVFTVSSVGVEQKTGQTIHLPVTPIGSKIDPSELDFSKDQKTPQNVVITGFHLGIADSITLTEKSNPKNTAVIALNLDALKSDTELHLAVDPTKLSGLSPTSTVYTITVVEGKQPTLITPQLSIKGATSKTPVPQKPIPPKNPTAASPTARAKPKS
jgi:hypothetical protein